MKFFIKSSECRKETFFDRHSPNKKVVKLMERYFVSFDKYKYIIIWAGEELADKYAANYNTNKLFKNISGNNVFALPMELFRGEPTEEGVLALYYIFKQQKYSILRYILKKGKPCINAKTKYYITHGEVSIYPFMYYACLPLIYDVEAEYYDVFQLMLENEADIKTGLDGVYVDAPGIAGNYNTISLTVDDIASEILKKKNDDMMYWLLKYQEHKIAPESEKKFMLKSSSVNEIYVSIRCYIGHIAVTVDYAEEDYGSGNRIGIFKDHSTRWFIYNTDTVSLKNEVYKYICKYGSGYGDISTEMKLQAKEQLEKIWPERN